MKSVAREIRSCLEVAHRQTYVPAETAGLVLACAFGGGVIAATYLILLCILRPS